MSTKLGTSQQAVLDHLKNRCRTSGQIGDALYDSTSSCAKPYRSSVVKTEWAGKILRSLVKRGLVGVTSKNPNTYALVNK